MERDTVVLPGVWDAITARIAAAAGAPALYLTGAGVTNSRLGVPDVALLTLLEMADQARNVCDVVNVPVIADADTGYGGTWNVLRTVREFERAGLAGLHVEDQVMPKKCGHLDGKELISKEEMCAKVRAAVHAKSDASFLIIARTDARGVTGLEDAIERANAYVDAGADAIFPEGLQSKEEFAAFREGVAAPLLANMTEFGKTPLISVEEFRSLGYNLVIFPMTAFRVMMKAVEEVYETLLREGTQSSLMGRMRSRQDLYDLIEYSKFEELDASLAHPKANKEN
ncbi:MAG: methylisocitrate lyase [Armatimonadetes bacterium]|nr:MAG: methylisocitrate lyase [Armatimonadota bacterium]GIV01210.1 MAG: methylisocitrate lyase [Fimbriimonadales bacterium]